MSISLILKLIWEGYNMTKHRLSIEEVNNEQVYTIKQSIHFNPVVTIKKEVCEEVFDFAYGMSFDKQGHHRNFRSGGKHKRRMGEVFANAFQGKLSEYAVYEFFKTKNVLFPKPDVDMYGKGLWDNSDFDYKDQKISVKSTKSFGQLILLEKDDWTKDGLYKPGEQDGLFNYFILVRVSIMVEALLKNARLLYSNSANQEQLKELVLKETYSFDIPGYMTRKTLIHLINENFLIPRGAYLNRIHPANKMDANNYYIQAASLNKINHLITELKNL